jgi:hypothetical protein
VAKDTHGIQEDDVGIAAFAKDGVKRIVRNPRSGIAQVARDGYFKVERRITKRFSDVELRQLRALERAYNSRKGGPEVLVFGDSMMFWTTAKDDSRAHLIDNISEALGLDVRFETLVGPGYNPRIVMAYLSALEKCSSQPKVVLVPTSPVMITSVWLSHPVLGWEHVSAELQSVIDGNGKRPRRLSRPGDDAENAFDRLPAPSLIGARRTVGELRLITNSPPLTRWQHVIRIRHLMDYYFAERLEPDGIGIQLVAELGAKLTDAGLRSIAYIQPVNYEIIAKTLGPKAPEHVGRNAEVVETAYSEAAGDLGSVVNATFDHPGNEFVDPAHLTSEGRNKFARRIADELRPLLTEEAT